MANTTVLIQEVSRGYVGHALDYDAQGKAFLAVAVSDPANANIIRVPVYMAQRGQPFNTTPIGTAIPVLKIDSIDLDHTGSTLVVSMTTHAPQEAPRPTAVEAFTIPGVWATTPGFEAERGGPGGFTGNEGQPPEADVDYVRIETIVNFVVSRIVGADQNDSLVHKIVGSAPQSLRQALRDDLDKDAVLGLLTGTDAKANQYKAALFDFTKNASANPWANVLGGLDDWGQARQEELKDIIREVLHEEALKAKAIKPKAGASESEDVGTGPKE